MAKPAIASIVARPVRGGCYALKGGGIPDHGMGVSSSKAIGPDASARCSMEAGFWPMASMLRKAQYDHLARGGQWGAAFSPGAVVSETAYNL